MAEVVTSSETILGIITDTDDKKNINYYCFKPVITNFVSLILTLSCFVETTHSETWVIRWHRLLYTYYQITYFQNSKVVIVSNCIPNI